jgi:hypothetical protein
MRKIFLVLIAGMLFTCTKEQVASRPYPRVETHDVVNVTASGALFQGEIIYTTGDITDRGFIWSQNQVPTVDNSDSVSVGAKNGTGMFSQTINRSLMAGITYYVRAYARSTNYFTYGDIVTFTSAGSTSPYSITGVIPSVDLLPREKVTVSGNFPPSFQLKIDGIPVDPTKISNITSGQITVVIPDTTKSPMSISMIISGNEYKLKKNFSLAASYKTRVKQSFTGRTSLYLNFSAGGKNYFYYGDSLFSYDPSTDKVTVVSHGIVPTRNAPFSFSINEIGYFGGGANPSGQPLKDFYSFDPNSNVITRLADLPVSASSIVGFSLNGKGYAIINVNYSTGKDQLYEYDPSSNTWTKKADFPGAESYAEDWFFVQDGLAYFGSADHLYSYNPASDSWTSVSLNFYLEYYWVNSYTILQANGKTYFAVWVTNTDFVSLTLFYEFQSANNAPTLLPFSTPWRLSVDGAFTVNGKGYFYYGNSVWEFNPSI